MQAARSAAPASGDDQMPIGSSFTRRDSASSTRSRSPSPSSNSDDYSDGPDTPRQGLRDAQDRLEWHDMLKAVLAGDVVTAEKARMGEVVTEATDRQLVQDDIWLGIRARLHGTLSGAEAQAVDQQRARIPDDAIHAIMSFSFTKVHEQSGLTATEALVRQLLSDFDLAASLFPTFARLAQSKPLALDPGFCGRLKALHAWSNVRSSMRSIQSALDFWLGDSTLSNPIPRDQEDISPESHATRSAFLTRRCERLLQDESMMRYFERTFLYVIPSILGRVRDAQVAHGRQMRNMCLPTFEAVAVPYMRFPIDFMRILVSMQAERVRSYNRLSPMILDELSNQLRNTLALACALKEVYMGLAVPDADAFWNIPDPVDPAYDVSVLEGVNCLAQLMNANLRLTSVDRFFDAAQLLQSQMSVLSDVGAQIRDGPLAVAQHLCDLTHDALTHATWYLERRQRSASSRHSTSPYGWGSEDALPALPEDAVEDALDRYRYLMPGGHLLYRKQIQFVSRLHASFGNAAEYRVTIDRLEPLLHSLASAGFVSLRMSHSDPTLLVLVSAETTSSPETMTKLLTGDWTAAAGFLRKPDNGVPDLTGYVLVVRTEGDATWQGSHVELDGSPPSDLTPGEIRLITSGTGPALRAAQRAFVTVAARSMHCVRTSMSSIPSVEKALRKVDVARSLLAQAIVRSALELHACLRTSLRAHADIQEAFGAAAMYSPYMIADSRDPEHLPVVVEGGSLLIDLAIQWSSFVSEDCSRDDRRTFAWAFKALEFAKLQTLDVLAFSFSADQFQQMRSAVGNCMSLLIGNYGVLESEGTAAQHQYAAALQDAADSGARGRSRDRRARNQQTEAQTKQLLQERALDAIHALEERREIFLREQRLAGHPLDVATPEDASITSLASSVSNVSMHWRKGRFLGAGSAGSVHLAVDEDGGNVMAVKEITFTRANPQAMANLQTLFKQELDLLEMLHHPNIVTFYGIEVHRDKVFIFEEFCSGGTLEELLREGPIADDILIQVYTLQMLEGMAYLHGLPALVSHGDLKPSNVLLNGQGTVKLNDFGAATAIFRANGGVVTRSSTPGPAPTMDGTPMFMAPEKIKGGPRSHHGAADVWALGCIVLQMCTGRHPWAELDDEWAIMYHIATATEPPDLPNVTSALGIDFIKACLLLDSAARPTAQALLDHPWMVACRTLSMQKVSPNSSM